MSFETILFDKREHVAILSLNQPERLNAISVKLREEVHAAVTDAHRDDAIRALVVTGIGRGFCSGADLSAVASGIRGTLPAPTTQFERLDEDGWVGRWAKMFHHFDKPGDSAKAVVRNSLTGQDNFIREAQLEFLFCAVLSARDPAGNFHHLKSFYWNVRWQARFLPHDFAAPLGGWFVTPIAAGEGSARSHVTEGEPTDKRFKDILTDTSVSGCNAIIPLYSPPPDGVLPVGNPGRRESNVWKDFDVRV